MRILPICWLCNRIKNEWPAIGRAILILVVLAALLASLHMLFLTSTTLAPTLLVAIILVALLASFDVLLVAPATLAGPFVVLFIIRHGTSSVRVRNPHANPTESDLKCFMNSEFN